MSKETRWPAPSMMLLTSNWGGMPSFSLMPVYEDCPYVEALYNPAHKTLAIIGKTKKDTFHMIPRLDDEGHPIKAKKGTPEKPNKLQRVNQESYTEYYLIDRSEIESFIQNFCVNHAEFDYKKTLDFEPMQDPSTVAKGPQLIVD